MLAQRAGTAATERPATAAAPKAGKPKQSAAAEASKRKLSFNEKRALETLPGRIDWLEAEIRRLHERLSDPGLFGRDPPGFDAAAEALRAAEAELAAAEEEWLRLELLRETVEG
jgi:ATP-binding cassette subfamily F protein uup